MLAGSARLLWTLLRWLTVLLALTLLALRIGLHYVDDEQANGVVGLVVPNNAVKVSGIRADWRGWNPQLRFDVVRFGESSIDGLQLELAVFESLLRRKLVLAAASGRAMTMVLARTESGRWGLAGMPPPADFDWRAMLWHSNTLAAQGMLRWRGAAADGGDAELGVRLLARNPDEQHRFRIELTAQDCPVARCRMTLALAHDAATAAPGSIDYLAVRAVDGPLALPTALTRDVPVRIQELLLVQGRHPGKGSSAAPPPSSESAAPPPLMKNAAPPLSLIAALQVGVGDERSDLLLGSQGQGTAAAGLGSAWLAFGRGASGAGMAAEASVRFTGDVADVSLDTLDLAAAERLLHTLLPNASRLRRWVHELEPRGTVRHLDARYRFATEQLSWRADLKSVAATGYRGIPTVAALDTQLLGYERGLQANVEIDDGEVGFVGIFPAPWPVHRLAAELNLHYRTGLLNLWADTIHVELRDPPTAAADTETAVARPIYTAQGRFRLTVPQAESLRRLALTIDMPAASVALAQQFLPAGLSSELRQWLLEAPRAGGFEHPRLAFAGDLKGSAADRQLQVDRRLALRGGFRDASLDYAAGWPGIDSASGTLEVSGSQVFAAVSAGRSAGVDITGSELSVGPPRDGLRTLGLTLRSRFEGPQGLAFLRRSPLLETVAFVTPDWRASGPAALAGRLSIPLGADTLEATGTVELTLDGTGLTMPGYGLALTGLDGVVTLDLPNQVRGTGLSGALHGEPIDFSVSSTPESSRIDFSGMATAATAGAILDQPPVGFASGRTAYQGWIDLPLPPSAAVPRLHVDTDLEGLRLELPAELGKSTRARRPTQLAIEFHDTEQWLSLVQAPLGGWFTVRDGTLIDGHAQILGTEEAKALGPASQFARRDPTTGTGGEGVRVTGGISAYDIADTGEDELGDILFQFDRFHIAELAVQAMPLGWVNLSGPLSGPLTRLEVTGSRLTGSVAALGDEPMVLDLESALLPDPYANGAPLAQLDTREVTEALTPQVPDPLDVSLIDELPAMVVRLGALTLGAEDFGSWSFELEPDAAGLRVRNLEADWLGLHIEGQDVLWSRSPNETVFAGTITGGDLKEILPRWGYVSPVVSESVELAVEVAWEGSPLNLELLELEGEAEFTARNGRFEDVESAGGGALRLLSLLNFNAVARRMNLDFSDVFGRGISFERINAISALDHGRLTLLKPMEIEGTGSSFALSGTVDLDTGLLDSEMVVTLPLTKGLPWYAAYVALANPLAGLGVLVGERVLRKPLEQFSSAKYEVRGSLDDPAVKLVGIFDNRIGSSGTVETPEPIAIDPTGLDPQ